MEFNIGKRLHFNRISKLIKPIIAFIKKLLSPIAKLLNEIEANYSDHSAIKKALIGFFRLRVVIFLSILLVTICAACFFAIHNNGEASAQMSLNYEESAKGLNPNSTRFNIYELKSPEVAERMLYYCGIDPEDVDLDKIVESISVNPTSAKGFNSEDYYIATSYRVSFKKPKEIGGLSAHDMVAFLCKAYTDLFYDRYAENRSVLNFDPKEFDELEFLLIADLLDMKAQQQNKYLNMRVKQSKTFSDSESDTTFKSLAESVEDFIKYDIEGYRSFVLQTGIAHNKAHLNRALDYVNLINGIKFDKDMASYDVRYDGIKLYNEAMISVVMIPTIDRENNNYYMSKTKTGMDYMANQADVFLGTAQETAKKIQTNSDIMAKMQVGENRSEDVVKAYKMIDEMQAKFSDLGRQIELIDKAYIKYKTKDYITFQISGISLMQRLRPDILVMLALILVGASFVALWIRFRYFSGGDRS